MGELRNFLDNLSRDQLVERMKLALEGSGLGVWDWDPRDNSVQFDRQWCEMLGLDHASVAMELSTWESRVHPDDLADCYRDIQAHMRGETERYENVHRMRHADGHWVYILDQGRIAARDADGRPSRFTGTHLDVTATERAKRVLEDQHRVLRDFVNHVPASVAMVDAKGCYLATSERWRQTFGAEPGRVPLVFGEPELARRWNDARPRAMAGAHVVLQEETWPDAHGRPQSWRMEVSPWHDHEGAPAGLLVAVEDITEEVTRRVSEERERRLAELGRIAGGVAHEVNTPLQLIELEAALLAAELQEPTPDAAEMTRGVWVIAETVQKLAGIISAMRSGLGAGRLAGPRTSSPGKVRPVATSMLPPEPGLASRGGAFEEVG